jgi:hypothetical protein
VSHDDPETTKGRSLEATTTGGAVIVVGTTNVNAFCWAHGSTKLATDALFHAVFVTVENVATMQAVWLVDLRVHLFGTLA